MMPTLASSALARLRGITVHPGTIGTRAVVAARPYLSLLITEGICTSCRIFLNMLNAVLAHKVASVLIVASLCMGLPLTAGCRGSLAHQVR
jgi:hypothetical protein